MWPRAPGPGINAASRGSSTLLTLALLLVPAAYADDPPVATLHYMQLYGFVQIGESLQRYDHLRTNLFIISTLPGVGPRDIKLTLHRASGALEDVPLKLNSQVELPVSDELKAEDPLIVTNQPKGSLRATFLIDLTPPTDTELRYSELMKGITQFNDAIDRKVNAIMSSSYAKSDGLLIFYNEGKHALVVHAAKGDYHIKGMSVTQAKPHLQYLPVDALPPSTNIIYVPLDPKLLKSDPKVSLDAFPAQTFPASSGAGPS